MTKTIIPDCDFGQSLWKWCGLSVREVNAEIETLDHRRKNITKLQFPLTSVLTFRIPAASGITYLIYNLFVC